MELRILILSDLHAFCPKKDGRASGDVSTDDVSFLRATDASTPGRPDPIDKLELVITKEGLEVDWIVCPGDLADKADPDAQAFVWRKLEALKSKLGAQLLISTAGNHDIDSRLKFTGFDAKGALQGLDPPFPGISEDACDKYWSRNFYVYETGDILLLNVNSAAFHGISSSVAEDPAEYLHGRVSQRTIDAVKKRLQSTKAKLHILLTHHHLEKDDSISESDYSAMDLGSRLVTEIQEATQANWFVLHGHQHYPRISYGRGTSFRPIIFSAGSLSATLTGEQAKTAVNQFYHVSIETETISNAMGPCGVTRAWYWAQRSEWKPSPGEHKIPDQCGFGHQPPINAIVSGIDIIVRKSATYVTYLDLCQEIPELRYVLKETFDHIITQLEHLGFKIFKAERYIDTILQFEKTGVS